MEAITRSIKTYVDGVDKPQNLRINDVRKGKGFLIKDYRDLIERIAALSFSNPEYVLFYRGQSSDHRTPQSLSSSYPSIFRGPDPPYGDELKSRFDILETAEQFLAAKYDFGPDREVAKKIRTYDVLRWAILQHYEVCPTPLLDVTHSLRVACSFAYYKNSEVKPFIYVLGLPQISGSVTASSEHGIQIIRLLSICPPKALRPHYQEGYLVGDFPTLRYREKLQYEREEVDFAQRLICKFKLPLAKKFWDKDFQPIPKRYLFPNETDEFLKLTQDLKLMLPHM